MKRFVSPLRYPGGKLKVVDYIKRLFEVNDLCDGTYIEPYAGGASVALSLLFSEYAQKIQINDIDKSIYAFWFSVLNETEALCRLIYDIPVNMETWNKQRQIQMHKEELDLLEIGFSTFFLNRTNRSGILKAGVIGGKEQTGKYKIDARYNKLSLIHRIESVAEYADRITLSNVDALDIIKNPISKEEKTICYLDPPYFVKGPDLYHNSYTNEDHRLIAETISHYPNKWIISYDADPFVKDLYKQYRTAEYYLSYSAGNPAKGKEIMVYSNNIIIPEGEIVKPKKV